MNLKYEVIISWSADDQAFLAEAPKLARWMRAARLHQFLPAGQLIASRG